MTEKIDAGQYSYLKLRTASGEIRALMNRCTHRGTTVCVEPQGNAKRFQCAYHGWMFSNTGENGCPTASFAYRLSSSFVVKSIYSSNLFLAQHARELNY